LHTVEVMAPADDIPESITIDLAGMDFHDSVHVSALKLPEGCRPISGTAELTVVTIVPPTVMVEETPAAGAAAAPAAGAAAAPAAGAPAKADAGKGAAAPAKGAAPAAKPAAAKPAAKK
jgi:large subunit ribosomal protein L25